MRGVFGQQALIADAADYLKSAGAPPETVDAVTAALKSAQSQRGTAAGRARAWPHDRAVRRLRGVRRGAAALNRVWRVREGRSFVRHKLHDVGWTIMLVVLVLVTCILIFLGGGLAGDVLRPRRAGRHGRRHLAGRPRGRRRCSSAMLIYAVVYYAAPNVEIRRLQYITPGAVFGVLAWILASAAFFVYVSNFATYSATYGAFATVVVLLVWL